jgi:phenylalanyl-tRNA synthetase alpha chain
LDDIKAIQEQASAWLAKVGTAESLEEWRIKYLGAKGAVKAAMQRLKEVPPDLKPAVGKVANQMRVALEAAFSERQQQLGRPQACRGGAPATDVTLPGRKPRIGHNR